MNAIIRAAVNHSRVVLLVLLVLLIAGTQSYISIPKEAEPDVSIPIIYTRVHLEGISAEDAETSIVRPLEQELKSIEGTKKIEGQAYESGGSVTLTFDAGFDSDVALEDVRQAVDRAKSKLPSQADDPITSEVNLSKFPVLVISLAGDIPERGLNTIAENLKSELEGLPQLLEVNIKGKRDEQVEIIVDPLILESYGLTEVDLLNALPRNNRLVTAGTIDTGSGRFPIKVPGTIENAQELYDLPIKVQNGRIVRFSDIADVRRIYKDPNSIARVGAQSAVTLELVKRSGTNLIDTIDGAKAIVETQQLKWPSGLKVTYYGDKSTGVRDMLTDLQNNVTSAVLLVLIVVIAAMGVRSALLVAVAVPGSFVIGILVISMLGLTINMVVLFSLIMAVGMLVDGAIVVGEFADRRLQEGHSKKEAYTEAAQRMAWPIISSTATTLAAFSPLLWFPGIPGQFMVYLPITLIATLSASLLMALIFVPTIGGLVGGAARVSEQTRTNLALAEHGDLNKIRGFVRRYISVVRWATSYPLFTVILVGALMYSIFMVYGVFNRGTEFFPTIEPERAQLAVRARGDMSIRERDDIVRRVEQLVVGVPEVSTVYSTTIAGQDRQSAPDMIGKVEMEFAPWYTRDRKAAQVIEALRAEASEIPGVIVEVQEEAAGPGGAEKPIQLSFLSAYPDATADAVLKVRQWMDQHGGFTDVEDSLPLPGIEWQISVDREEAGRYGADVALVGSFVQLVTSGLKLSTYRPVDAEDEIDIRVRYPAEYRSIGTIQNMRVPTKNGYVSIGQFVKFEPSQEVPTVDRLDGKRAYRLKAAAKPLEGESYTNLGQLASSRLGEMQDLAQSLNIDPRVEVRFEGQDEDQKDAQAFLSKAMGVALALMTGILVAQFNSFYQTFVVLLAVILSIGGVLLGLLAIGEAFAILMCGIGTVALAGIVVNNNIVLIDTFNEQRGKCNSVQEAIIRTAAMRLRPVLLTSITTVLGLLPMVLRLNIDLINRGLTYDAPSTQWWVQMSAALAGGMTLSTLLTLILTPALLMAHATHKERKAARRALVRLDPLPGAATAPIDQAPEPDENVDAEASPTPLPEAKPVVL